MKYLVTVGTTPFDNLIAVVDEIAAHYQEHEFFCQIGPGHFKPKNARYTDFIPDLLLIHKDALVISHLGAGTVYKLLEQGREFIGVPNLSRADRHQIELYRYLRRKNLALTVFDPEDLWIVFQFSLWSRAGFMPYCKDPFFKKEELLGILGR
jgi:beta-1,4-N-acetylglucosaminyltransferase